MKKFLFLVIFLHFSQNAYSADPAKIAVVDMQRLLASSTAALDIKEQAKKEREKYQASIVKEEEQLRKEEAKLEQQRTILTKEAFTEKSRPFRDKVTKVQRDLQEKRAVHEENIKKSLDQVNQVVFEIIESLSKEDGFEIAIPTSQILFATKQLDITDKVLDRLNKQLPKLPPRKQKDNKNISEKKASDTKK